MILFRGQLKTSDVYAQVRKVIAQLVENRFIIRVLLSIELFRSSWPKEVKSVWKAVPSIMECSKTKTLPLSIQIRAICPWLTKDLIRIVPNSS